MGLAHSANMIKMAIHNMNFKHASTVLRERERKKKQKIESARIFKSVYNHDGYASTFNHKNTLFCFLLSAAVCYGESAGSIPYFNAT